MKYVIVVVVAAWLCLIFALSGAGRRDDSDPPSGRSGIVPRRDALTGCEYLTYGTVYGAAITPRMDRNGKQICR